MKGKLKIVCIVAICLCVLGCIWFVLHERVDHGSAGTTKPQQLTEKALGNTNNSRIVSVGTDSETSSGGQSDLKFLDVMWPFLPERYQKMINEAKAEGKAWIPTSFSDMAKFSGLVGIIEQNGNLQKVYDALAIAALNDPNNLNTARMLLFVSASECFSKNEYNKQLENLARLDSNEDVTLLYVQFQMERGDKELAYNMVCRNVMEHPDQASSILTSALRIFTEAKATDQKKMVVGKLKKVALDAFHADCCARYLYVNGDIADAIFFYEMNADNKDHPFFRETAQVKLCRIKIANKAHDEQTIETLKKLAMNSDTPAIKAEAHRVLSALNIGLPHSTDNSNNNPSEN